MGFVSEWKTSLQFVQWLGGFAKLIRKLQLCFLVARQLQNYLRPPRLPCNWGLLELRCTPGASCVAIAQLITSDDSFKETELLKSVLQNCNNFSLRQEGRGKRLAPNIQLSSGCDPSLNPHPGVSAAWSVIDQFPPSPNPPNDSQLAPGRTTPSCLAFN